MGSVALEGFGGGSNPLNFRVIGNPRPETAKENTIWVDTDRINNYYFSATQPENMAEYDVWFSVGTSSPVEFSATKKNPIMVYPLSAKQYVDGALVGKTAKSYQGGKWVDWIRYLYNQGNEYTEITGGWFISRNKGATLTKNVNNMVFTSDSAASSSAITIQKGTEFDFDSHKTVCVELSAFSKKNPDYSNVEITFRTGVDHDSSEDINALKFTDTIVSNTTLKLEIPNASVQVFFIYLYNGSATIENVWLE